MVLSKINPKISYPELKKMYDEGWVENAEPIKKVSTIHNNNQLQFHIWDEIGW